MSKLDISTLSNTFILGWSSLYWISAYHNNIRNARRVCGLDSTDQ